MVGSSLRMMSIIDGRLLTAPGLGAADVEEVDAGVEDCCWLLTEALIDFWICCGSSPVCSRYVGSSFQGSGFFTAGAPDVLLGVCVGGATASRAAL